MTNHPNRSRDAVFVFLVRHGHGHDISVHETDLGARVALETYAREWWNKEMPRDTAGHPPPMPADPENLVAAYFKTVKGETWAIEKHEVQP